MRAKWYVGHSVLHQKLEAFKSCSLPAAITQGAHYSYVIGPFQTKRGAQFCATNYHGPCFQTISDFEKAAKKEESK